MALVPLGPPLLLPIWNVKLAGMAPPAENAPAPAGTDETLDASVLASLKELRQPGQPDPIVELVQLFLKDAKPKVDSLECFAAVRKAEDLKAAAHSLKGSSSNLGAHRLAALLKELETACKAGDWNEIEGLLPRVQTEFQRVQERLVSEVGA